MATGRVPRLTSIFIDTSLIDYVPNLGEATFTFEVKAEYDGSIVYDKVVPITFNKPGTQSVKVDGIRVGSYCCVELKECGVYQSFDGRNEVIIEELPLAEGDHINIVPFSFDYSALLYKSKSLLNHFTYDNSPYGDGDWKFIDNNNVLESNYTDNNGYIVDDVTTEAPDIAIHETVEGNVKNITIKNIGDKPAYIRAKIIRPSNVQVGYSGKGWFDGGDQYWYYGSAIQPGQSTDVLECTCILPLKEEDYDYLTMECNVVVIADSTIVLENRYNGPSYEGWLLTVKQE